MIDTEPRTEGLTDEQADDLRALARQVSGLLEMRRAVDRREVLIAEQQGRVREKDARDALAHSEALHHTLFDSIEEGFCVIRFIDGPRGPMSDYVHVEANPAFAHHLGIPHVAGQTLRDIAPNEQTGAWLQRYGDVLRTGQPTRFDRIFGPTGRHLEVAAHRVEPPSRREVAVLFTDIRVRGWASR